MKHSLRGLCATLLASSTLLGTALVIPGSNATTEGNGSTITGAFFGSNTIQVQIAESELMAQGLQPGYAITGLSWRLGGGVTNSPESIISDLEILLGQAVNTVAGMTSTFASNITGAVMVHDGAYTFAAGSMPGGATPNAFGPALQFTVAYVYQGGDLVLQVNRQPASAGLTLDASSSYAGAGTTYQGVTGTFGATSGTMTNHFPVMQLSYAVPEPASFALAGVGLVALAARKLRRKR